jgi:hypothetical protein
MGIEIGGVAEIGELAVQHGITIPQTVQGLHDRGASGEVGFAPPPALYIVPLFGPRKQEEAPEMLSPGPRCFDV